MWQILIYGILFILLILFFTFINATTRLRNVNRKARFGTDREIVLENGRIHIVKSGDGPPLILLPDLLFSSRTWNPILPVLSPHFQCITIDYPGIGTSHFSEDFELTLELLTTSIETVVKTLELETVDICGYGLGGRLAIELLQQNSMPIHRAIAIGAFPDLTASAFFSETTLYSKLEKPILGRPYASLLKSGLLAEKAVRAITGDRWAQMSKREQENMVRDTAMALNEINRYSFLDLVATWHECNELPTDIDIKRPLLHLVGTQSFYQVTRHPAIEALKKQPHVSQWLVPDSHSELHWQRPQWTAKIIADFLQENGIFTSPEGGIWRVEPETNAN
ncbi:alpha/beta hydrolase [bacterium]|nr:alpha/beta hydrolase [bacterium]